MYLIDETTRLNTSSQNSANKASGISDVQDHSPSHPVINKDETNAVAGVFNKDESTRLNTSSQNYGNEASRNPDVQNHSLLHPEINKEETNAVAGVFKDETTRLNTSSQNSGNEASGNPDVQNHSLPHPVINKEETNAVAGVYKDESTRLNTSLQNSGDEASRISDVQDHSPSPLVTNTEIPSITPQVETDVDIISSHSTSGSPSLKDDAGNNREADMISSVPSDEAVSRDRKQRTSSINKHEDGTPQPTVRNEGVHSVLINAIGPDPAGLKAKKVPNPKSREAERKERGGNSFFSANILYDQFIQEMSLVVLAALVLLGVLGIYRRLGSN